MASGDIKIIDGTIAGHALLTDINRSNVQVYVSEASAWRIFHRNPTPIEDLQQSVTFPNIEKDQFGHQTTLNSISVRYAQHWFAKYDGVFTRSYLTLVHELQHVIDIMYGISDRMDGERRAVAKENIIREELKIPEIRLFYHGIKL